MWNMCVHHLCCRQGCNHLRPCDRRGRHIPLQLPSGQVINPLLTPQIASGHSKAIKVPRLKWKLESACTECIWVLDCLASAPSSRILNVCSFHYLGFNATIFKSSKFLFKVPTPPATPTLATLCNVPCTVSGSPGGWLIVATSCSAWRKISSQATAN